MNSLCRGRALAGCKRVLSGMNLLSSTCSASAWPPGVWVGGGGSGDGCYDFTGLERGVLSSRKGPGHLGAGHPQTLGLGSVAPVTHGLAFLRLVRPRELSQVDPILLSTMCPPFSSPLSLTSPLPQYMSIRGWLQGPRTFPIFPTSKPLLLLECPFHGLHLSKSPILQILAPPP